MRGLRRVFINTKSNKPDLRYFRRGRAGFTLIEVIIIIAILGIVMGGIMAVYFDVLAINKSNDYYSHAYRDLDSKIETLRATPFANLAVGTTTSSVTDLPGTNQVNTVITDTIDGVSQTGKGIYQVTVTVSWTYKRTTQISESTYITNGGLHK